jgi:pimeloyl-ACP methyl ester carboxylesterase
MLSEQFFHTGDIQINFAKSVDKRQPLVLLHGIASQWQSFMPLIPELTEDFQIFAPDLRGHGQSGRGGQDYRILDYCTDMHLFLEQVIAEPAILYGHSLGAMIALAVAAQAPERVHGLILGDPPFFNHNLALKESVWYEPFVELHTLISNYQTAAEMDAYMAEKYPKMDPDRRKARAATLAQVDPAVIAVQLAQRHMEGFATDALLRQIKCPVLLLAGNPQLGSALRVEDVETMAARIRNLEIVDMAEIGHGLPAGEPLARVKSFLKSL